MPLKVDIRGINFCKRLKKLDPNFGKNHKKITSKVKVKRAKINILAFLNFLLSDLRRFSKLY